MNLIHQRCLYLVFLPFCLLLVLLISLPYDANASTSVQSSSSSLSISNFNTTPLITSTISHHHYYYHAFYNSLCHGDHLFWSLMFHVIRFWIAVECLFYFYFFISHNRLQTTKKPSQPLTREQRTQLYWRCMDTIEEVESWGVGWFYYAHDMSHPTFDQIHRENVALWFSWAFWHDHMSYVLANDEWAEELDWMIRTAEEKYKIIFPAGYNPDLQCIRLNLDPVQAMHRPLLVYLGLYIITTIFNSVLLKWWWQFDVYGDHSIVWGGALYQLHKGCLWVGKHLFGKTQQLQIPSRTTSGSPKDLHSTTSESVTNFMSDHTQRIVYWYRPATTGGTQTPLVFIHGIGAGLIPYVEFIYHMLKLDRPMMLVELPYVSMRMVDDVPEAHIVVKDIKQMLHTHGFQQAVFVSHSLGTGVTSWLMSNAPSIVAGTILIDPICFLLHYPHVCFNFIHRLPTRLLEYVMFYGASRELYISHYISRHFQWFQCIYFADTNNKDPQHSPLNNATVFLSEADGIVGSPQVSKYLAACGVDYRMMPGLEHAGFLWDWTWRKQILNQIDWVARNVDDEGVDLRS